MAKDSVKFNIRSICKHRTPSMGDLDAEAWISPRIPFGNGNESKKMADELHKDAPGSLVERPGVYVWLFDRKCCAQLPLRFLHCGMTVKGVMRERTREHLRNAFNGKDHVSRLKGDSLEHIVTPKTDSAKCIEKADEISKALSEIRILYIAVSGDCRSEFIPLLEGALGRAAIDHFSALHNSVGKHQITNTVRALRRACEFKRNAAWTEFQRVVSELAAKM